MRKITQSFSEELYDQTSVTTSIQPCQIRFAWRIACKIIDKKYLQCFIVNNKLLSSSRSLMMSVWGKNHWVNFALRILRMSYKKTNDRVVCISANIIGPHPLLTITLGRIIITFCSSHWTSGQVKWNLFIFLVSGRIYIWKHCRLTSLHSKYGNIYRKK